MARPPVFPAEDMESDFGDAGISQLRELSLQPTERQLLQNGLAEWSGLARAPEGLASALGFAGLEDLDAWLPEAERRLWAQEPMDPLDWLRCLVLTEIAFVSDVVGSGTDWSTTTGLSDEETIRLLRSLQLRLGPVVVEARSGEDGSLS